VETDNSKCLLSLSKCTLYFEIPFSLHGNSLSDDGMKCLVNALQAHPKITSLDVGDCALTDDGLQHICILLPPEEGKTCLHTLTLTGNKNITQMGWSYFAIAIAASSRLRNLYLDYNKIGNYGTGVLAVAMAASATLEKVDFEGCGITESGAELLFDLVANYPTSLKEINLADNDISEELQEQIKQCLMDDDVEDDNDDSQTA
jgi:Ran GTPase-activating protein (RanGAP) involved in mRNA processing and transport